MRRQLSTGIGMILAMTVLVGLAYPLAMTGVSEVAFPRQADGSLLKRDGKLVGSALLAQGFSRPEFFHPRPSAAGAEGYDGSASAASNLGPSNTKLLDAVEQRVVAYRRDNGLGPDVSVPVDAVTASGSGLDPQISVANARIQAPRVARERGVALDEVLRLVDAHTQGRPLGIMGEKGVNVLELNLALDERQ